MKKCASLILALSLVLSLAACAQPAAQDPAASSAESEFPTMTWSAATSGAVGSNFDAGLVKFKELLAERTNGAITLQIYNSDQLTNGSTVDSVQENIDGTIDVTFQADGIWANFDPMANIPNLPFIFSNYEEVDSRLIKGEGGQYIANSLESKYNVEILGIGENGFRYITNSKHPVKTPEDLTDLKLRVGGSPALTGAYSLWNCDYTTVGWAEVYTGLQTGLYDGQENPIAVANASSIHEVQDYVTAWTAHYGCMFLAINRDLYNSLSDDLKAIVEECGREACEYQIQVTRDECDKYLAEWEAAGLEIYHMPEETQEQFRQMSLPLYDDYTEYQELIDLLSGK